jgi:hypothetical protein
MTRGQIQAIIDDLENHLTPDGIVQRAELENILTRLNQNTFNPNSDTFPSTGGGTGTGGSSTLDQVPFVIKMGKPLLAFGNSITQHDFYVKAMFDYFRSSSRQSWTNAGESTRGQIKRINQENRLPVNRTSIVSWMNGINDIRFNNNTTNYKWRHVEHVRHFLCNAFAASLTTSASPSNLVGTWQNWDKGIANNFRTNGRYTTDFNGRIDFNFPAGVKSVFVVFATNFPGDTEDFSSNVSIGCEGVLVDTINLNKRSTGYDPYTWHLPRTYFENSGGGGVTIENKDAGKKMIVDYFGYLMDPIDCEPAIVWDNTYVANELMVPGPSDGGNVVPSNINRAWFDECDQAVRDMIVADFTKYGYPVMMPRSNTFFDPANYTYTPGAGLSTFGVWDGLHPNFWGHQQVFDALRLCSIIQP